MIRHLRTILASTFIAFSLVSCSGIWDVGKAEQNGTDSAGARAVAATSTGASANAVTATGATAGKRVVGYFCEWGIYAAHDQYFVTSIPFDKLTHINYAFVGINPSTYGVEIYDPWATQEIVYPGESWDTTYKGNLGMLRKMKLQHPNVKVLISVGGWTKSHGFHAAAMTEASRNTTAANLVAFMKANGLDGIDIDWEYPGVNRAADTNDPYDKGAPGGPEDKANYTLFLKAIREKLDVQGAADGKHYELTAAVGIGYDKIELTNPGEYSAYLDAVNLMTYDMHGGFETTIGHQAPLYANPNDTHEALVNERYNIEWTVSKFLELGVPASKLIVGVPFYSRGWNNVSGGWDVDGNGTPDGMFGTGGGSLAGKWGVGGQSPYFAMKALALESGWEKYRDPISNAAWLYNRTKQELYTYDDAQTVTAKMDYVLARNLGGAMYWELDGDDWKNGYDLVNIIADKILGEVPPTDTQAPTAPASVVASNVASTSLNLSWAASSDNVGVAGYVVSWTGGSKTVSATSAAITGLAASTEYAFSVKAFDAAGNYSAAATVTAKTADPVIDTSAPSVPTGLALAGTTSSSVSLTWNASTDNVGVTGYQILSGTAVVANATATSGTVSGLASDTSYTFAVRALDAAGNASALSASVTAKTLTDETGKATGVPGTPSIQQSSWNGEATFSITMNMWWGNNGTKFELLENDVVIDERTLTDNSPSAQALTVTIANRANGTYRYVARLTNRFGSTSSSVLTYTVTKGSGGTTDVTSPTAPSNVSVSAVTASSVTVSWGASSDNVGVTGYTVSWNGGSATASGTGCSITGLSASTSYTVSVKAKDAAGNESAAGTVSFTTEAGGGGTDYPAWALNGSYAAGAKVSYAGSVYQCLVTHVAYSENWNPAEASTLWSKVN